MNEDASRVISQHETILVEDDVFDRFVKTCDSAALLFNLCFSFGSIGCSQK